MSEELKPCAHCGSRGELVTYYDFYHINCTNDDCVEHYDESMIYRGEGAWYGSIADAIEAWNTRTPDQAIAATLGGVNPDGLPNGLTLSDDGKLLNWRGENYVRQSELCGGKLTAEQVRKVVDRNCEWYEGGEIDAQAIADELNATLGSGTCHMSFIDEYETASGEEEYLCECSECGHTRWEPAHDLPLFCSKCGKAVKR